MVAAPGTSPERCVTDSPAAMNVLVVLINHQSCTLTVACVQSLRQHCTVSLSILIGDNSPASEAETLRAELPNCSIVELTENRGFAAAINETLRSTQLSDDQLVLILNPDTYCTSDFVAPLVKHFCSEDRIGAVSPTIRTTRDNLWYAGGHLSNLKGGPKHHLQINRKMPQPVSFVTGCALLTSWRIYRNAGGLPEHYFLYFEDAHFSVALQREKYSLYWVPEAEIYHHVSATTDVTSALYGYFFARNRLWFMKYYAKGWRLCSFYLIHFLIRMPAALGYYAAALQSWQHMRFYLRGLVDGLKRPGSVPARPIRCE